MTRPDRQPDIHKLAFDERFGLLVDAEWLYRENKRLATALRDAMLRLVNACIEDIVEHQNVLISGATGTGKPTSRARSRSRVVSKGHRALYRRAARPIVDDRSPRTSTSHRSFTAHAFAVLSRRTHAR